jgi:hypothetical protein
MLPPHGPTRPRSRIAPAYVQKAIRVASDQDYRRHLRQELASRSDVLFNDRTAVEDHERFIEKAIGSASR